MSLKTVAFTEATPLLAREHSSPEDTQECQPPSKFASLLGPQLTTVLLVRTCEALAVFSIQPFINQFVRDLGVAGGDDRKVGYYVGLMGSLYYTAMAVTVLHWNRISDYVGRKPVLLTGLLGSTLSLICVGLSGQYWVLVASRCIWGLLDGNLGVTKSIIGEITEGADQAQAFALTFVVYGLGASTGPLIGGSLQNPYLRFPNLFGGHFWQQHPYFLPCLTTASFIFGTFLYAAFFFTNANQPFPKHPPSTPLSLEEGTQEAQDDKPVPLRQLMVYPVVISIANYASLELLNGSIVAFLPVFLAMPIEVGGINFDPPTIGYAIGGHHAVTSLLQGFVLPKAISKFGVRWTFILAMSCHVGVFILFPIINLAAKQSGVGPTVYIGVVAMLVLASCANMTYGAIFMIITSVSPNKRSLGTTNGLSQTVVSIPRIIAPALVTSLFSFSAQRQILGGYAVYAVYLTLSCFAVLLALGLPRRL